MNRKLVIGVVVAVAVALVFSLQVLRNLNNTELTTATVERGTVQKMISVSGYLEADNLAALSFPQSDRLSSLMVSEGDLVEAGQLLATAGSGARAAERQKYVALLEQAHADRDQVVNGLTLEARAVSSTTIEQAQVAYENTKRIEEEKVAAARDSLFSVDLEARTNKSGEDATPPTVSGSYTCEAEGSYRIEVYSSGTNSGYSIRYEGLESGTAPVSVYQPVVLGDCGLSLQFAEDVSYNQSDWIISVPNTHSNTYLQRLYAYELAKEQAEENIAAARYAYELAENANTRDTAAPRVEAMLAANAAVSAAEADVSRLDALLTDVAIYAPFSGVVTNITTSVGEVATGPVLSLVSHDTYTLIARVPEIDIRRLAVDQSVNATFDASASEQISGKVIYVSPTATVIDGVSYFETNISLNEKPDWLRDGLNADIDIVVEEMTDVLRVPNRFIIQDKVGHTVLLKNGKKTATTSVELVLQGSDGYAVISGLSEGDTVVAP